MMGEFELIEKLVKKLPPTSPEVELGIGDDAAVLKSFKGNLLLTIDSLVENVHFDFSFCDPFEVGHKALAVNLSDIAAMGGRPRAALIALTIPISLESKILEDIYRGISQLAQKYGVDVVGGNTSRSLQGLSITLAVVGEGEDRVLTRAKAKEGDIVFISGCLGQAAAGLSLLKAQGAQARKSYPNLCDRYLKPEPRLSLGETLATIPGVHSLIDISDGLSSELWHLSKASSSQFLIKENQLPVSADLKRAADELGIPFRSWVLAGGEDYELLGTCSPETAREVIETGTQLGIPITLIGEVDAGSPQVLIDTGKSQTEILAAKGWDHFKTL